MQQIGIIMLSKRINIIFYECNEQNRGHCSKKLLVKLFSVMEKKDKLSEAFLKKIIKNRFNVVRKYYLFPSSARGSPN